MGRSVLEIVAGVALLYVGGDLLVRSAIAISVRFGISRLLMGLTIVALGTSLPELFVSVAAALRGAPAIAAANVIGSNIINISLILSLALMVRPVAVGWRIRAIDYPVMVGSFLVVALLLVQWSTIGEGGVSHARLSLSRVDGAILLGALAGYLFYVVRSVRRERGARNGVAKNGVAKNGGVEAGMPDTASMPSADTADTPSAAENTPRGEAAPMRISVALLYSVMGAVALAFGSNVLVGGATAIAKVLRISERVIALTVVAHGTNLPEIFTTIAALRKRESGIALGNMIGSNIINTLFVLGMVGVLAPLTIASSRFLFDLGALLVISVFIFCVLLAGRGGKSLRRRHGVLILLTYIGYFVWVVIAS